MITRIVRIRLEERAQKRSQDVSTKGRLKIDSGRRSASRERWEEGHGAAERKLLDVVSNKELTIFDTISESANPKTRRVFTKRKV